MISIYLFGSILFYAGLSTSDGGQHFFIFLLLTLLFSLASAQLFRLIACACKSASLAQPIAGVFTVIMVLFSGFIQPKADIPKGWLWMYWLNPMSWMFSAVSINEFTSPDYDFGVCVNPPACTTQMKFGELSLNSRGILTDFPWVWYAVGVLIAEYILFLVLTGVVLKYFRFEDSPTPLVHPESVATNK